MTSTWASVALGGTKCTTAIADLTDGVVTWLASSALPTRESPAEMLGQLTAALGAQLEQAGSPSLDGIGIVCGSPLDEQAGLVLAPPNLPAWQSVDVLGPFEQSFGVRPRLMNDANAGALAEWCWGAGRGAASCVFLTLGTGLGAGIILDGRLYRGARGLAGEIGHWRLAPDGPVGHGKAGSFEGFCGGSGIGRWAQSIAAGRLAEDRPSALAADWAALAEITAQSAGLAADAGDEAALALWADAGRRLGAGLALLIDVLNPEVIALGGIYPRQRERLEPPMRAVIEAEALPEAVACCQIVPAALGEHIGEWSGLAVALSAERPERLHEYASATPPKPRDRIIPSRIDRNQIDRNRITGSGQASGDQAGPNFDG
ncbi:MAG TPA: ROK family protein [Streptosporangiaceae bacterium]|nr:ROK family protein [Streptosporangiaceae bacterium]